MLLKAAYYLRFGSGRVPWMVIKEGHDGSEYVIFPMDRSGFKISKHPFAAPICGTTVASRSGLTSRLCGR
jgi:hypothetical protein